MDQPKEVVASDPTCIGEDSEPYICFEDNDPYDITEDGERVER